MREVGQRKMFKEPTRIISKSIIEYLGEKYNFDIEEELKLLSIEDGKEEIKSEEEPVRSKKQVKIGHRQKNVRWVNR